MRRRQYLSVMAISIAGCGGSDGGQSGGDGGSGSSGDDIEGGSETTKRINVSTEIVEDSTGNKKEVLVVSPKNKELPSGTKITLEGGGSTFEGTFSESVSPDQKAYIAFEELELLIFVGGLRENNPVGVNYGAGYFDIKNATVVIETGNFTEKHSVTFRGI